MLWHECTGASRCAFCRSRCGSRTRRHHRTTVNSSSPPTPSPRSQCCGVAVVDSIVAHPSIASNSKGAAKQSDLRHRHPKASLLLVPRGLVRPSRPERGSESQSPHMDCTHRPTIGPPRPRAHPSQPSAMQRAVRPRRMRHPCPSRVSSFDPLIDFTRDFQFQTHCTVIISIRLLPHFCLQPPRARAPARAGSRSTTLKENG